MAASSSAGEAALLMENSSEQVLSMPGRKANVAKISKKKKDRKIYNEINYTFSLTTIGLPQLTIKGSRLELQLKVKQTGNTTLEVEFFKSLNQMLMIELNHFSLANIILCAGGK